MTTGNKYRIFIEERLRVTEDTLVYAENALKIFQEEHHTVVLDIEVQNAISTIAELKSQIILLEAKKGALKSSSQVSNPILNNVEKQLRELKKQLYKIEFGDTTKIGDNFGAGFSIPFIQLPEVSLEYIRLYRDVKVQEAVYELLTQQYEQAKIMELKDTPTVQVLDHASPPEKRSFPKRSIIIFLVFIGAIALNIIIVFSIEHIVENRNREKSNIFRMFLLWSDVRKDISRIIRYLRK